MNTSAAKTATAFLKENATKRLAKEADKLVAAGTHTWIWDPQFDDVIGLVKKGTNHAEIVIYVADNDFECDGDFEVSF
jgi:hypothetical protein